MNAPIWTIITLAITNWFSHVIPADQSWYSMQILFNLLIIMMAAIDDYHVTPIAVTCGLSAFNQAIILIDIGAISDYFYDKYVDTETSLFYVLILIITVSFFTRDEYGTPESNS